MEKFIEFDDKEYPASLKSIPNPPKRLFYKGNLKLLNEDCIAIIGSRDLSQYGKNVGRKFVKDIALRDITVVSGMAIGADRLAHEETLNVGGKTIAVMGTGVSQIYPSENLDLYKRIINEGGLVITEYADNIEYKSSNFPKRNRIISGLSKAVLIIEAKYRSGTSITAKHAWEQGRKVYAIPGRLDSKNGVGVNNIIKIGGKLVSTADDILQDFDEFKNREKRVIIQNNGVKKEYRKIYEVLGDVPISIEEIAFKTKNAEKCVAKLLTLMELEDLIEQEIGAGYVRKKL